MRGFDGRDAFFTGNHAINKIRNMVVTLIQMNFIFADLFIENRFRVGVMAAAVCPYAAVFAFYTGLLL